MCACEHVCVCAHVGVFCVCMLARVCLVEGKSSLFTCCAAVHVQRVRHDLATKQYENAYMVSLLLRWNVIYKKLPYNFKWY